MNTQSVPEHGDVVVRRETRDGDHVFVLQTAPGPDQVVLHDLDDAVKEARAFGRLKQVRVWLADGDDLTLVRDFRVNPIIEG